MFAILWRKIFSSEMAIAKPAEDMRMKFLSRDYGDEFRLKELCLQRP